MKILSESDPEAFEDVDPDNDDEAINEEIEDSFDPESIESVVGLYDHPARDADRALYGPGDGRRDAS
jgi:hypothetical protein